MSTEDNEAAWTLRDCVAQRAGLFRKLGHPALLDEFILRNGAVQQGEPLMKGIKRMPLKQCFANAAQVTLERGWFYVEGYAASATIGIPLLHAWNVTPDGKLVDVTWRTPETTQYLGVPFNKEAMSRWLVKLRHYGLLDTGLGLNVELMFGMDPELKVEFDKIRGAK
jgi:hypothetical protein